MSNELKLLLGEPYTLTTGEIVTLGKVPFGKLHIFSAALTSLFAKVETLTNSLVMLNARAGVALVLDAAFEEAVAIMGLLLNKPREWFDDLDPSDGIEIALRLYEKNVDERLKKNLVGLLKPVISLLQTRFKFLSVPAIDGKISGASTPSTTSQLSAEASESSETEKGQT